MQARPDPELSQLLAQADHAGFHRLAVVETGAVFDVHTVGGGVLGDDQQLLHARVGQAFGFCQHLANRTAHQIATHRRDDAEGTAVVAAFGNFQVGVVARRQLHALFRHQAQERVVLWFGDVVMNMFQHLLVAVRACDLKHFRVHFADLIHLRAQAAGDNHFAVFRQGFTNGFQ